VVWYWQLVEELNFPPVLAFSHEDIKAAAPGASNLAQALPPNIKLLTLTNNYAAHNNGTILLRLAHLYAHGEHPTLSAAVTLSLRAVFAKSGLTVASAEETSLTANQVRTTPSWPRSWANSSLPSLCSHRNAWASLRLLGQPDTFLAPARGHHGCQPLERPVEHRRRWRRAAAAQRRRPAPHGHCSAHGSAHVPGGAGVAAGPSNTFVTTYLV
jgi:hypothetical protein